MGHYTAQVSIRLIILQLATALSLFFLLVLHTHAESPPNLYLDIPWDEQPEVAGYQKFFANKQAIENAFNNARREEERQLDLPAYILGKLHLPSDWNRFSIDARALYLLNHERQDRAGMLPNVTGLPLTGVEQNIDEIAEYYARLLHDTNKKGHNQPSGNAKVHSPFRRIAHHHGIGSFEQGFRFGSEQACHEFLSWGENLAYFAKRANYPLDERDLPYVLERSIYGWLYEDSDSKWGHRETALLQNKDLQQKRPTNGFKNNYGSPAHEGFLGVSLLASKQYDPFHNPNPDVLRYSYGVVVVMNIFDPVSDHKAQQHACHYQVKLHTDQLPQR